MTSWQEAKVAKWVELPFVSLDTSRDGARPCFWDVTPSGDDDADRALGRAHALKLTSYARDAKDSEILALVLEDLVTGVDKAGVTAGFLDAIGVALLGKSDPANLISKEP
ncbi:MAG: hypothetical protein A2885_09405 [Sphingopyxis sp. RIFCSPHIGHO2_01_FULL_65_24]|nr:MAG: hypothetical protein A2885_09405 [Sphingopyxis sp. RIFCSPHIGHO2_01_FULL_65_24]